MEKVQGNKEQLYILSLDNGIQREEPIIMDVYNSFKDGSQLVQLNKNVFGVYKNNSNKENVYIDDLDIIKSDIAELFDVSHEEVSRIVNNTKNCGTFTTLNYSKDIETRISATTVFDHIIKYMDKGLLSVEENNWVKKVLAYPHSKTAPIKDLVQVEEVLELGTFMLNKEIYLQKGENLDARSKDALKKNYLRMILFDLIVGRRNRGLDYYLISRVNERNKPEWTDAYLAPISVDTNIDRDNLVDSNAYILNNKIIDKNALISVLYNRYYREIRKMTEALLDARRLYSDAISRIIYNNIEIEEAKKLESQIEKNIEEIIKYQKVKEKELNKEHKTNKVERTMATQSLNVKVTAKLDLIQKKYPINPKEHPELLNKDTKEKKTKKKKLKVVVEKDKKKTGFATTSIITAIIALSLGIIAGIAFILVYFGS